MFRTSIAALGMLIILNAPVSAHGGGHGGIGGGRATVGSFGLNGFVPFGYHGSRGYPLFGLWGGYGYGGMPYYYFEDNTPDYSQSAPAIVSPEPSVLNLSGEYPATLYLDLPTTGEVWVNGAKEAGKPMKEWTLTSPVLKPDKEFNFDITARWISNGKTFEYKGKIALLCGNSSRLRVLSGTEVK
jgi:hypothetical protein